MHCTLPVPSEAPFAQCVQDCLSGAKQLKAFTQTPRHLSQSGRIYLATDIAWQEVAFRQDSYVCRSRLEAAKQLRAVNRELEAAQGEEGGLKGQTQQIDQEMVHIMSDIQKGAARHDHLRYAALLSLSHHQSCQSLLRSSQPGTRCMNEIFALQCGRHMQLP